MTTVSAIYYDGKSSQKWEVQIHFEPLGQLRITGLENDLTYTLSKVRITPRVANTPRSIYLPGGAKCETLDNDTIDEILRRQGSGRWPAFLHLLESRLRYVLLLLVLTVAGVWGFIEYGLPALAKRAAYALPASADAAMGREGLRVLDRVLFSPSALEETPRAQLLALFDDLTRELADDHDFRLEFRRSPAAGPNAFALPSGIIIVTDELVLLAEHQNELLAVLTHEIGHVIHRHALRRLLQDSAVVLLIASITGDITSITTLSGALPTMLVEAKYSRAFETEADQFALQYLLAHSIPPKYFADILSRLEKETEYAGEIPNFLASHPATGKRIKMFRGEE